MANAARDENNVPTLLAASSVDGKTPVRVYADPTTHRLLADIPGAVAGPDTSVTGEIAAFDGTTGKIIKNSNATVDFNNGNMVVQGNLTVIGNIDAPEYKGNGNAPVANGVYTVGIGGTTNGTITVTGGIITAIQEAT